VVNSHLMLGNISRPKRFFPPFHFYEIYITVNFDYAVNLLNNSFTVVAANSKCLTDEDTTLFKKAI
jgi:hypothetical protein